MTLTLRFIVGTFTPGSPGHPDYAYLPTDKLSTHIRLHPSSTKYVKIDIVFKHYIFVFLKYFLLLLMLYSKHTTSTNIISFNQM